MNKYYIFITSLCIFVVMLVILCFSIIGTPFDQKAISLDKQRLSNLSAIYSRISTYYETNNSLPVTLTALQGSSTYDNVDTYIKDPETKSLFEYRVTSDKSYQICLNFSADSLKQDSYSLETLSAANRLYKRGHNCFTYTISTRSNRYNYAVPTPTPTIAHSGITMTIDKKNAPSPNSPQNRDILRRNILYNIQLLINNYYYKFTNYPETLDDLTSAGMLQDKVSNYPYKITYVLNTDKKDYQLCADFEIFKQKCISQGSVVRDLK